MALKATIYKADLQIADMDRRYYADHTLTIARHPSETDERMMVRLLAFALFAHESLTFSKGLFDVDEPDLWQKDLTGAIEHWIDVGLPDSTRLRKACGRATRVSVMCYAASADIWWRPLRDKVAHLHNLTVLQIPAHTSQQLAKLAQRGMRLQATVQDGQLWLGNSDATEQVELLTLQSART